MPRPDASTKIAAATPKNSNRTLVAILVTVLVVAAISVAVFYAIGASRTNVVASGTSSAGASGAGSAAGVPKGAATVGAPIVLNPGAPANVPVVDIYEDPQCPACKLFEDVYGSTVNDLVKGNKAKVQVHTLSFLDRMLRNDSSVKAANGAMCAADQGRFHAYVSVAYAGQPKEEGTGYTAAQLEGFATSAGVGDLAAWRTCQNALTYTSHIGAVQTNANKAGVTGTPTVRVAGTDLRLTGNPQDLVTAVQAATK